ncbi:hypothetical protein ACFXO2_20500, partial [Streptomyces sp. NPDC059152]|uniref:hypothetical protein n=1 Tax=Streptomyces sp. NPDC059152 TaxID=3346742 RepID=UPI0036B3AD08
MMQVPEPRDIAPRLASGAFILNAGLTMWKSDREAAEAVHGMASAAYPFLSELPPERFTRLLAASEIAIGGALLAPFVPTRLAGVALTGFAGGLVGLYLRGARRGPPRPPPPPPPGPPPAPATTGGGRRPGGR